MRNSKVTEQREEQAKLLSEYFKDNPLVLEWQGKEFVIVISIPRYGYVLSNGDIKENIYTRTDECFLSKINGELLHKEWKEVVFNNLETSLNVDGLAFDKRFRDSISSLVTTLSPAEILFNQDQKIRNFFGNSHNYPNYFVLELLDILSIEDVLKGEWLDKTWKEASNAIVLAKTFKGA